MTSSSPTVPKHAGPSSNKVSVILDSGAYSAWKLGKPVILSEYCAYLKNNLDWISHYVNLDVINPKDPEAAAAASFANLLEMRKAGLDPVPVFHVGEDVSWLYRMLDLGCRYIGLSASSLVSRGQCDDWYALAWSHLVDNAGLPLVRAHAFGEGRYESLRKFPWASADSTSWIYTAERTGVLRLTCGRRIGMRNDKHSVNNAPDVEDLDALNHAEFVRLAEEAGIKDVSVFEKRDREAGVLRLYMTSFFYRKQTERINKLCPISSPISGFFGGNAHALSICSPIHLPELEFSLVIDNNLAAYPACAYNKQRHVLASYFYVKTTGHHNVLRSFVRDPIATVHNTPIMQPSAEILRRHLT